MHGYYGSGFPFLGYSWIGFSIIAVLAIVAIVLALRARRAPAPAAATALSFDDPRAAGLRVASERFARGELSREEYETMAATLGR